MRRRLFWTIAGVAAATGFLVLAAGVVAGQRAAVTATYREMAQSSAEIVDVIEDAFGRRDRRPEELRQLFALAEQDPVGPVLSRIRRAAGGSELVFGAIRDHQLAPASADLLHEISLEIDRLLEGGSQFARSSEGELVVVTPATIQTRAGTEVLLVALARTAPVVRAADQVRAFIPIAFGVAVIAALMARLLSNQVAGRMAPLAAASRRLAAGELSTRVPDLQDPELDEVARAFNEMATALEESDEREREFILGVGHDLRTPLTTIGGYAEALETGDVPTEDLARVGKVLGVQTRQLSRLIDDLAVLARLDQPEFGLRGETVDVGAHVAEVVEGFNRRAEELGVRLTVEAVEGLVMNIDPDRLAQITQNLIENALRFTPEPGSISVEVAAEDSGLRLEVSDSGVGIPEEDLPHVFDRHFTGRQRPLRNEGTGLGLSIVNGLVTRMGGSVSASSSPGLGTTIVVNLPGQPGL